MSKLRVGIITHNSVQQHHLRQVIKESHCETAVALFVDHIIENSQLVHQLDSTIDVWLVDIDTTRIEATTDFDNWLYSDDKTVIFGEGLSSGEAQGDIEPWLRQVKIKLEDARRNKDTLIETDPVAKHVWVLSASTGGPEAVKQFLDAVPIGLSVCFVYVQHIETGQDKVLANIISRDNEYRAMNICDGHKFISDRVMVVSPDQQFAVLENGSVQLKNIPWRGVYQPSMDQVVAMVAAQFGKQSGAIFFTGLGDDGIAGARLIAKKGGQVWIQSPDSCIADVMPKAIHETGLVSLIARPRELATLFVKEIKSA